MNNKIWLCTTMMSIFGPSQGAARLNAYMKKQGYDVTLKDFNQDTYFTLFSRDYLEMLYEKLTLAVSSVRLNKFIREEIGGVVLSSSNQAIRRLMLQDILGKTFLKTLIEGPDYISAPLYKLLGSKIREDNVFYALLLEKDHIIDEVTKANSKLDSQFLSLPPDEFIDCYKKLLCGKALFDAVYFPAQLDLGLGFTGTEYSPGARDIYRAVTDERHNYLIPYYRQEVMPQFKKEMPGVVGFSITHGSEYIPALTLASMIKEESPETHICLGGAVLTETSHRLSRNPQLWEFFDSLILGPGEVSFGELVETIDTGGDLSKVPNLIFRNGSSITRSSQTREFDINDACTPEYASIRPKPILPLETSSGCYWGRCIFCYYPKEGTADLNVEYQENRIRDIDLVIEDMKTLKEKYDPVYIGITDSSLHPKRIEKIAEYNVANNRAIQFSGFVRFEKDFKSLEFCEKIAAGGFLGGQTGLESGSQKVNDIINKGVRVTDATVIIRNFNKAGILIHLYSMVGLPGEQREDSLKTLEFLKNHHKMLTLGWQIYSLGVTEHGPLAARAEEFGLTLTPMADDYLAQVMMYESKNGMSQSESMAMSINIYEKLKKYLHPLNGIMDVESHKVFLLAQKAGGINPNKLNHV